jgi:hypothetical protein
MKIMITGRSKVKRKWKRPELIVLLKGKSEENVLMHCKAGSGVGPQMGIGQCKFEEGGPPPTICTANCELAPTT